MGEQVSMHDYSGWTAVACTEADAIRAAQAVVPGSTLSDPSGTYGAPVMFTEWWTKDDDRPLLRDYYWLPHAEDGWCVHYVTEEGKSERPEDC